MINITLCITEKFSKQIGLNRYTWCRDSVSQRPLVDFCIVSTEIIEVFWQTIRRLASNDHKLLDPSNTKAVPYSAIRRTSLSDGESILYIIDILNPRHSDTSRHARGAFWGENTIIATEVFMAVKKLKSGKAAGCDEIRPEMLEDLKR